MAIVASEGRTVFGVRIHVEPEFFVPSFLFSSSKAESLGTASAFECSIDIPMSGTNGVVLPRNISADGRIMIEVQTFPEEMSGHVCGAGFAEVVHDFLDG